jgi:hypothetical protein
MNQTEMISGMEIQPVRRTSHRVIVHVRAWLLDVVVSGSR